MNKSDIRRLVLSLKPYYLIIFVCSLILLCDAAIKVRIQYGIQRVMDSVVNKNSGVFIKYLWFSIGLTTLGMVTAYFSKYFSEKFCNLFNYNTRNKLISHVQELPIYVLKKYSSGDLVSRINNDLPILIQFLNGSLQCVSNLLLIILASAYMIYISPKLFLVTFVLMPLSTLIYDKINKPAQEYSAKLMKDSSKVNDILQDVLSGMYVLKSFKLEKIFSKKFQDISTGIKFKNLKIDKLNAYLTPIFLIVKLAPQLIYITYGGYLAIHKEMSIGGLLAFSTLVFYVAGPVEIILNFIGSARGAIPAIKRIFEIIDLKVEENNKKDLEPDLESVPVEFENAAFSYDGKNKVFQNISFKAPKNSYTALVGSSGIGKSTILKLICGFYNLNGGKIKIFGNDIANINIKSVRKLITYMSQESYLYPITISENIAMGKENASMEEIIKAAKFANAHEFIEKLPSGYDTLIGEGGGGLSGGQCQRVALARMILKDAEIVLLDEPTAALDAKAEAILSETLEKITKNKTVIVVAHKLATIKNASNIIVFDKNGIIEMGTHKKLMEKKGAYRRLYENSFGADKGGLAI